MTLEIAGGLRLETSLASNRATNRFSIIENESEKQKRVRIRLRVRVRERERE